MIYTIKQIIRLLSKREKKLFFLLFIASFFISFLETFAVSAVMIFATVATNLNIVHSNKYFSFAYRFLGSSSPSNFVILFGLLLVLFYIFRFFITSVFIYVQSRFAQGRFQNLAYRFFQIYLQLPYKDFFVNHSSEIHKVIFSDTNNISHIITSLLVILSESLTVVLIYTTLIFVNFKMTLALTVFLGIKIFFIIKTFSKKLEQSGVQSNLILTSLFKLFNESFNNFKLIKLISNQKTFLDDFFKKSRSLIKLNTLNSVLQTLPRIILETVGFSMLISVIVYVVYMYNNATFVIPIISMYAMAFYRFLPSVNKILASYNQILFCKHSLQSSEKHLALNTENIGQEKIEFKKNIEFENLKFAYIEKKDVLTKVNLIISRGQKVAFIGDSGAGKSTLADILMGLYSIKDGKILVDGKQVNFKNVKSWRSKIGYIPQNIFLFDGTVAENVVFGRKFNKDKIKNSLQKAKIYNFLSSKNGLQTRVGENGIMLSGGQKQRIAIARALYANPDILVLDEATSALDDKTEAKIMSEIYDLNHDKTLIIIAHRLSTIQRCDKIYKIENGDLAQVYFSTTIKNKYMEREILK